MRKLYIASFSTDSAVVGTAGLLKDSVVTYCSAVPSLITEAYMAEKCVLQSQNGNRNIEFPMYLMSVDGKRWFMSIQEAGVAYDSNYCRVEIVGPVLDAPDFSVRDITRDERSKISEIADENSANK